MKKFREDKGITLIALIITIVVLLILAVVAIGQAQETNIVGYAQNASSKYAEGQGEEVNMISSYESLLESMIGPWSPLTVPVQFDKKYSNYVTADGETTYVEITLYSDGRLNYMGNEISKEDLVDIINEGALKITSRALEFNFGVKFEFSEDGKQITIYQDGNYIGVLYTEEKEPISNEWTTYGTESMYFLVGTDKAYAILQGNLFATYTIETGTLEGSGEYPENIIPSYLKGASKVLISNEGNIGAVLMPNNNFYTIGGSVNAISADLLPINNNIDYSSILEQIQ